MTIFEGVPTMYAAMLHLPEADPAMAATLRVCVSGGASLPVEILRGFEEKFGCMILEGYGLSETSPVASFNHPDKVRKPGSIGTPIEGVQMRLVDDAGQTVPDGEIGEIAIRGHNVMKGYWNKPEATAEAITDGWFRTGDMARVDSDGYYYIVDRKKDLIIRGGYNVYPREIEEVLHEHPAVAEVAVIGLPHPDLGEEVGAAVALKPGASATPEELRAFARDRVAAYKYPRRVWLVDALPKGPTGKILRREVHAASRGRQLSEQEPTWAQDAVDAAGGLDLLLTDAALGVMRRLRPDSSLLRLAAGLARRPRLVGRQAAQLGAELGRIAAGRSALAPPPRDRRFADPAWTGNPLLRRSVQAYLAAAQSAEALVAGAELGWRDDDAAEVPARQPDRRGRPEQQPAAQPGRLPRPLIDTGGRQRRPRPAGARHRPGRAAPGAVHGGRRTPSRWARTWRSRRAAVVHATRAVRAHPVPARPPRASTATRC